MSMPYLQMIYGPHNNSDFLDLEPILSARLRVLKEETDNIHSILEFVGPDNSLFNSIYTHFQQESEETIFGWIKKGLIEAISRYVRERIPIFQVGNGFIIAFQVPTFQCRVIDAFRADNVILHLEDAQYHDWLNIRPYLEDSSFDGSEEERVSRFIETLADTERTFRNQIREIAKSHPGTSFIIIRGDMHRIYYEEIQNEFGDNYEVNEVTYGHLWHPE